MIVRRYEVLVDELGRIIGIIMDPHGITHDQAAVDFEQAVQILRGERVRVGESESGATSETCLPLDDIVRGHPFAANPALYGACGFELDGSAFGLCGAPREHHVDGGPD